MTNIYAHLADGDAPKNQHVTEVSFVDETGKHVDISGGASNITHDDTLAGSGTADSPLKLADTVTADIAKGKEITLDNINGAIESGDAVQWNTAYVGTFNNSLTIKVASSLTTFSQNKGIDLATNVKNKINGAVQTSQLSNVIPLATPKTATTEEIATLLNQLITALKTLPASASNAVMLNETM